MSAEQWNEQGLCYECRKKNYCGKECKAHKDRVRYEINKFITEKMDKQTGGVYSKIMEYSPYKLF